MQTRHVAQVKDESGADTCRASNVANSACPYQAQERPGLRVPIDGGEPAEQHSHEEAEEVHLHGGDESAL